MLVKCIKRIPSARYQADGRFWEVSVQDIAYLQKMGQWAKDMRLVTNVRGSRTGPCSRMSLCPCLGWRFPTIC